MMSGSGGVFIKQGITIGNGAVIGMGAVVTKSVPPYAIVAGNPARLIRMRFDEELIEKIEASKWWTMSDEKLKDLSNYITNPQTFCEIIEKLADQGYEFVTVSELLQNPSTGYKYYSATYKKG